MYVSNPAIARQHGLDPERALFVFVDCEGFGSFQSADLYLYFQREIASRLGEAYAEFLSTSATDQGTAYLSLVRLVHQVRREGWQLILMLDEFEWLAANRNLDVDFFGGLRSLAITHRVVFLTASKVRLDQLSSNERETMLGSNFFNIFNVVHLNLFSESDSRDLISDGFQQCGASLSPEIFNWILQAGGRHPFFLQVAGDCAYQAVVEKEFQAIDADFDSLSACFVHQAKGHFRYYWEQLNSHEKYMLATLSWSQQQRLYQSALLRLQEQCLVVKADDGYRPFSSQFERFIEGQEVEYLLRAGPLLIDRRRREVLAHGRPLLLSPIYYDLLLYLAERPGQPVSHTELDQAVWQPEQSVGAEERVKTGIKELRRALEGDAKHIVSHRGVGYAFDPEPDLHIATRGSDDES
jgi:DNA-binding winged helix-turn-helix (wHTH) protein